MLRCQVIPTKKEHCIIITLKLSPKVLNSQLFDYQKTLARLSNHTELVDGEHYL